MVDSILTYCSWFIIHWSSSVVLILSCILLQTRDTKTKRSEDSISNLFEGSSELNEVIIEVTENFDDKYVISRGVHGIVYKATLSSGEVYAIEKLVISAAVLTKARSTLDKIWHKNLIKLKDFWSRGDWVHTI
jgi:hypothetical protein